MENEKIISVFTEGKKKKEIPLYTIGIVSELVGTTNQTLRLYEKRGLIRPDRKNKNRFYSENNIRWLLCLRLLIHKKKISIEGIKKLLEFAPCWEIMGCPDNLRNECHAYIDNINPCQEHNQMMCRHKPNETYEDRVILLSEKTRLRKRNGDGSE